jgi:hypothetical protein
MADKEKQLIAKCAFITDIVAILYNRVPDAFGSRTQENYRHFLYKKFFGEGVKQWTIKYFGKVATIKARETKTGFMFYIYTIKI